MRLIFNLNMNAENAPTLKSHKLTTKYAVAIEPKTKEKLQYLKDSKRIDVPALIRQKIDEILLMFDL